MTRRRRPLDVSDFRPEGVGRETDRSPIGRTGYALGMLLGWALVLAGVALLVLVAAWVVIAAWAVTFG